VALLVCGAIALAGAGGDGKARGAARSPQAIGAFMEQTKLVGSDLGFRLLGASVALSDDGSTALVGGWRDANLAGAAWVFTRQGSSWTQQGPKLTPSDAQGAASFGGSVALSANGAIALIGGSGDDGGAGAAWIYTRSGSTWTRTQKLVPNDEQGAGRFGAVALSADGATALIGAANDNGGYGAAWIFTRSGSTWTQQGGKLFVDFDAGLGGSVALSADGATALLGGPHYQTDVGAAWVFTRSGSTWSEQGFLRAADGQTLDLLGSSVALAGDGSTALVGGRGAAWFFTRSGSTWTQQGPRLSGQVADGFGSSVALSDDGSTGLVGASNDSGFKGAAWVYRRSGSTWSQSEKLVPTSSSADPASGGAEFGDSTALSADGSTALVGGPRDDNGGATYRAGAAWVFVVRGPAPPPQPAPPPPVDTRPVVTALQPALGRLRGGEKIVILGSNLFGGTSVRFGTAAALELIAVSATRIEAVSPPGQPGQVHVAVTTAAGTSAPTSADLFTYVDTQPPTPPVLDGRFASGALLLGWRRAADDVGIDHYLLLRDGKPVRRISGSSARTALLRFRATRRTVLSLTAFDAAGNAGRSRPLLVTPRARPPGAPRLVPVWARQLLAWETHGRRGARPRTPRPLPAWYARWKAWRLVPYRLTS
jgi:hypothetical protein